MTPPSTACHACSVPGCGTQIAYDMLMCRTHWFAVAPALRTQVMTAWRSYQAGNLPIDELREVQRRATEDVTDGTKGGAS